MESPVWWLSRSGIYERLAYRHNDITAPRTGGIVADSSLSHLRPLGRYGGDKLIYDAPTAHGGSGARSLTPKAKLSASTPLTWTDSLRDTRGRRRVSASAARSSAETSANASHLTINRRRGCPNQRL